jgi:aspartyl aminopeptidase
MAAADQFQEARALCRFIDHSPSSAHACATLVAELTAQGFTVLDERRADWGLGEGRYLVVRGSSVVAFVLRRRGFARVHIVGAHTDSPHLRLKPRAAYACEGCLQLGVEVYGGALWNSWLDRDLGLAGIVHTLDGGSRLVRIAAPLARVAQLAIHLDRKVNDDGLKLNPQLHLAPLWGLVGPGGPGTSGQDAQQRLGELIGVPAAEIAAHELSLYDLAPATLGGADDALIFAGRLDNLASCHAGCTALRGAQGGDPDTLAVLACFDHEEVGSASDSGADGALLSTTLERIAREVGMAANQLAAALAGSLMLSADMAHALHPNYTDKHEPRHRPQLGAGVVLKSNANVRYATSAASAAAVRRLAGRTGVPLQDFVARSDVGCGSTIGPKVAARLGILVCDLGTPMLSMHSARECAASADHAPYIALLRAHLRGD